MDSHPLNFISLCTGGGGLDLGFELAAERSCCVAMVEREAWGCAHLVAAIEAGLLADAPLWSNVRTFNGRPWRGAVDFVIGGIPCQPHSMAGQRRGAADERDLWSPTRRIIVQSGAWGVLIENVEGMLTASDGQVPGAYRVVNDLERLGFSVEIGLFSASEVGATHRRARVFILAMADANGLEFGRQPSVGQLPVDEQDVGNGGGPLADAGSGGRSGRKNDAERGSISRAFAEWTECAGRPPGPKDYGMWRRIIEHSPHLAPALSRIDAAEIAGLQTLAAMGEACASPSAQSEFRRMADGVATQMDTDRIDRLRMLGNGVHPLEAAYAIRTLGARLAEKGVAGAAEFFCDRNDRHPGGVRIIRRGPI